MDYDFWKKDRKTIGAVICNIEIIGEAASHIPDNIQERYADIPWYEVKLEHRLSRAWPAPAA
jgi:uncharacterized protein with HEPN domain